MKVLVLGGNGMLGTQVVKHLSEEFEVYTIGRTKCISSKTHIDIDINNSTELSTFLKANFFHFIINSAAIIDHIACELNPVDCLKINALINKILLECTEETTRLIYISSDAVFSDFTKERLPASPTSAQSMYGLSKELGEKILISSNKFRNYLIIRTTIVGFNSNKKGYIEWIINSLKNGKQITLFDDVVFNPISIYKISSILKTLILSDKINRNILHLNSSEKTTKYHFGHLLAQNLKLNIEQIKKGSLKDYNSKGNRCFNQFLDITGNDYQGINLPTTQQTINDIIKHIKNDSN